MLKLWFIASLCSLSGFAYAEQKPQPLEITVHRSPSCNCCGRWITHLEQNNFKVNDVLSKTMPAVKNKYHIPDVMASCHTAVIQGYAIEGHVPANDIKTLLKMKPNIIGISVPAMPVGTPGMEMGNKGDDYQVVSFDKNNQYKVVREYKVKK